MLATSAPVSSAPLDEVVKFWESVVLWFGKESEKLRE